MVERNLGIEYVIPCNLGFGYVVPYNLGIGYVIPCNLGLWGPYGPMPPFSLSLFPKTLYLK